MTKTFRIDKSRIVDYKLRNVLRIAKMTGFIWFIFIVISFISEKPNYISLLFTTLLIFGLVLIFGLIAILKKEKIFESFSIRVENDKIFRFGELYKSDLINTNFNISEIGKLKKCTNGFLVVKKGCNRLFKYHLLRMVGIYENDLIWIPYILDDYEELINYLKSYNL